MPHTIPDTTLSPAVAESPQVRYTDVLYPYSGLFPFAADTTQAAKEKALCVNTADLTKKRPPEKVAYREKIRPNRVKKEFDEEGADPENGVEGIGLFYFGARYYDAEIGCWSSTDPKDQFWSGYSYTSNWTNPIFGLDPNGEEFELLGFSEADAARFQMAIRYISTSRDIGRELAHEWVRVKYTDKKNRFYRGVVYWNPKAALVLDAENYQSPAMGLAHEIGHAYLIRTDESVHAMNTSLQVENHLVQEVETPLAEELGEPARPYYSYNESRYETVEYVTQHKNDGVIIVHEEDGEYIEDADDSNEDGRVENEEE